jgi:hypothetical protein
VCRAGYEHFLSPCLWHYGNDLPLYPGEDYIGLPATTTRAQEPRANRERTSGRRIGRHLGAMGHDLADRTVGTM